MPRNLILYGLAALAGLAIYFVLRSLLGAEIMVIVALLALVAGGRDRVPQFTDEPESRGGDV